MDDLLVDLVVESYEEAPRQIVLDIDATDFEFHGDQEDRFFHGYYNEHWLSTCRVMGCRQQSEQGPEGVERVQSRARVSRYERNTTAHDRKNHASARIATTGATAAGDPARQAKYASPKRKVLPLQNIHPRFVRLPSHLSPHHTYSGCG